MSWYVRRQRAGQHQYIFSLIQRSSNYYIIALITHHSKIHLLLPRLKSFLVLEIVEKYADFLLGLGTREQILNLRQNLEKSRELNTAIYLCFFDYSKIFELVNFKKNLSVKELQYHLILLIRNLQNKNCQFYLTYMANSNLRGY